MPITDIQIQVNRFTSEVQQPVLLRITAGQPGGPKIQYLEGDKVLKETALNPAGFNLLTDLDLMRRPNSLKVGAMRNWVELDGELFRFDDGSNGAARLEQELNGRYVSEANGGDIQNVAVFDNPASPTGFDLQFPSRASGLAENRRRHLNEETIQILQHPDKCAILRTGTAVVLAPPHLVFKRRHADLSESHLPPGPSSLVVTHGSDGQDRIVDLSQPVDLSRLTSAELRAVFNHPAVNRRAALAELAKAQALRPAA